MAKAVTATRRDLMQTVLRPAVLNYCGDCPLAVGPPASTVVSMRTSITDLAYVGYPLTFVLACRSHAAGPEVHGQRAHRSAARQLIREVTADTARGPLVSLHCGQRRRALEPVLEQ